MFLLLIFFFIFYTKHAIKKEKSKRLKTFLIVSGMFNRHPLHYQELLLLGIPATEECSFRDLRADKLLSTFNLAQKQKKQYVHNTKSCGAHSMHLTFSSSGVILSPFGAFPQYLLRYLLECPVKGGKHLARYSGRVYLRSQTKVNNAVPTVKVQIILKSHETVASSPISEYEYLRFP